MKERRDGHDSTSGGLQATDMHPDETEQNANESLVDRNGQMYDSCTSIGVLLPQVSLHVCRVCIHFPTVLHTETEVTRRMEEDIPGVAGVTLILHLKLMVLQCFCT